MTRIDLVQRTLKEGRKEAYSQGKNFYQENTIYIDNDFNKRKSWSSPKPDIRDPQPIGIITQDLTKARGWSSHIAEGSVFGLWRCIVGDQIADHANPTNLKEGVLKISAESSAWATQLRIVQTKILSKITSALGNNIVTSLKIFGPIGTSWGKTNYRLSIRNQYDN